MEEASDSQDSQDGYGEADIQKLKVGFEALTFAWGQKPFRWWIAICTLGIVIGLLLGIGMTQLVLLVVVACIGWAMELANGAIETLLDIVHPSFSPKVKVVKDAFAGVCIFCYSAYIISWLILVVPSLVRWAG